MHLVERIELEMLPELAYLPVVSPAPAMRSVCTHSNRQRTHSVVSADLIPISRRYDDRMPSYDFRTLNDKDFEAIVVDLLSLLEGKRIERFKPGKDRGVDGRFFASDGSETVIQCKHWVGSGYAKLLAHLRQSELPKLRKLGCSRYLFATSVPLSRDNKRELMQTLAPYVVAESDIFGPEDLDDLLGQHPDVERRHYGLWLSSVVALKEIFSDAILGRSRAELEEIREEAPLYVSTEDYHHALELLEREHILILTGQPGIGKTTLARQLILGHVIRDFELVAIEDSLTDAEAIFTRDGKQIFYYDDFLGRTYLEALNPKQDSHTIGFIKRIARSADKRFILTSRTGILNQGAAVSDLFADLLARKQPYELAVEHLTRLDRARILYNHLWHSRLGVEYVEQLYADKRYHAVIGHKNFNPRLVAFVLDHARVGDIPPERYWQFVQRTLANPSEVWDHVFDAQLDQNSRDLVFLTVLHGGRITEQVLRTAFAVVPARAKQHVGQVEHDFRRAAKHASGSVLQRYIDASRSVAYDVFNPSIVDYVVNRFSESESNLWGYYLPCLRSRFALYQFEHLQKLGQISRDQYQATLHMVVAVEVARTTPRDAFTWRVAITLLNDTALAAAHCAFIATCLSDPPLPGEIGLNDYLALLTNCEVYVDRETAHKFAGALPGLLDVEEVPIDEPALLNTAVAALERLGDERYASRLRADILDAWDHYACDAVRDGGVLGNFLHPEDIGDATDCLRNYFKDQLKDVGISLTEAEIDSLEQRIDVQSVIEESLAADARADQQREEWRERRHEELVETSLIDDLFERG